MSGEELKKLFGSNLRKYREDYAETQEKFSERLGIGESTYKNIERGARGTSFDSLADIADRLGISASELLEEDGKAAGRTRIDKLLQNRSESFIMLVEQMIQALDQYDTTHGESENSGRG